mgnify:CR=1 FL=1
MMTEQEYRDMYGEYCMEGGSRMTERGFEEFKAWRKRVEALFRASFEQDKDYAGSDSS